MLEKVLIAAAIVIASPAFVSAQDIFWSFSPTEVTSTSSADSGSGSAYIFSDGLFGFDAIDLNFTTSDSSVIQFTGGEAFDSKFTTLGGSRFDSSVVTVTAAGDTGNLFSVSVTQNGVNPALSPLFDPGFVAGVGPNGAVLLARVDYDIVGSGVADLEFTLGPLGAIELPSTVLNPSFGSASLNVVVLNLCYNGLPDEVLPMIPGDLNVDCTVNAYDIAIFIWILITGGYETLADIDQNGVVNFLDIAPFITLLN